MTGSRIAVTGVGIVSALGVGADRSFERLLAGDRAFSPISLFDTAGQRVAFGGEVPDFDVAAVVGEKKASVWSRSAALALVAAREAMKNAGLPPDTPSLGLSVGITTGGMLEAEAVLASSSAASLGSARRLVSYPLSSAADRLSTEFPGVEHATTICSACSSGANALVQAAAWLGTGKLDAVVAGGTDALCRLTLTGFNALGATDPSPCRPFDRRRAGLTLGEGAGFLVLETEASARRRGAKILAWFSGWAAGAEAHHITQPEPSGRVPLALLVQAMARAGLAPSDVDYVNAHGTGTVPNDEVETRALHAAFGRDVERVLVSSSKGQIGHTLGAAGAIEAAITVLAVASQRVPPTAGLEEPDDSCRLNHVMRWGRAAGVRAALSSSFGFGGTGTVLAFERENASAKVGAARRRTPLAVTAVASIGPKGIVVGAENVLAFSGVPSPSPPSLAELASTLVDPARSRRFDAHASLTSAGAAAVVEGAGLLPRETGLVAGTAFGNVERTVAFLRTAFEKGPRRAPPAEFPHLLPSSASGNASIYLGLSGPVLSTGDLDASAEAAMSLGCDWLDAGFASAMVVGSAEPADAFVRDVLGPACEENRRARRGEGAAWVALEGEGAARARGAKVHAVVVERVHATVSSIERRAVASPSNAGRAFVVCDHTEGEIARFLVRSGWSAVPRRSAEPYAGFHEGLGGVAFSAAIGAISAGDADEVLLVGRSSVRVYAFLLRKPA